MNKSNRTRKLVVSALIAAIYAALTLWLAPISYGSIQCRLSEVMVLLAFIDPFYIWGLTLGCFIANGLGPDAVANIIYGVPATFISVVFVAYTGKWFKDRKWAIYIASLWPVLFNGLIIGFMLYKLLNLPLVLTILQVGIGEFFAVSIAGIIVYKLVFVKLKKMNVI
ncbi:MAG: QueT transporter family protein [Sarcina sp.]